MAHGDEGLRYNSARSLFPPAHKLNALNTIFHRWNRKTIVTGGEHNWLKMFKKEFQVGVCKKFLFICNFIYI